MPKQVIITDANDLANVPLPNHGSSYTVVSHKFIIDETLAQLSASGFIVDKEEYCRNLNGEVALGVYHLQYGNDPEMGLMFTWANSYDKTMRFRCAIGAHTYTSEARMIAGDISNYGRIHTGDAKQQVKDHIKLQIQSANSYFNELVQHKDKMKNIILTESQVAELMGLLYFKEDVLTSSQLINVKEEYKKPSYSYTAHENSLWTIYNHVIVALKKAHPKSWMEQQKRLHALVDGKYLSIASTTTSESDKPIINPNQTNLLDQINELESSEEKEETKTSLLSLDDYDTNQEKNDYEKLEPEDGEEIPHVSELSSEHKSNEILKVISESDEEINDLEETSSEFPDPPANLPVYDDVTNDSVEVIEESKEEPKAGAEELMQTFDSDFPDGDLKFEPEIVQAETCVNDDFYEKTQETDKIIPLEEQVAGELVAVVTPEEKSLSKEPVIDKPEEKKKEEKKEDFEWLDEGPTHDENFEFDDVETTNKPLIDDLDFNF